jgi:DNA-binding XRE family transcriptional regulator
VSTKLLVEEQLIFAVLIEQVRKRLKLTQGKFAAKWGATYLMVNRWENEQTKQSPLALKLIDVEADGRSRKGFASKVFSKIEGTVACKNNNATLSAKAKRPKRAKTCLGMGI